MPVFDTPITTDDNNLPKVLNQNLPVALILYDSRHRGMHRAVDEAANHAAREYAGQLLVARVDVTTNPTTLRDYGNLTTPAVVTLLKDGAGRKVKSQAGNVQAAGLQAHINYLLGKGPAPQQTSPKATNRHGTASSNHTATGTPQVVTDATFEREVLKSELPVLVDFWAPWCGPCRMIAPAVEQVAQKYADKARVVKVNVDENPAIARQFQIMSIPTLMTFKDGQMVKRQVGANPTIIPSMIEETLR